VAIPFVSVRHPRPHDIVDDPVEVAGVGTGFESTLQARLRNHADDPDVIVPGQVLRIPQ
jgi:hypothetical protein